jgi:hypothetical protein
MLIGTVTDATGAPVWAVNITIMDPHGHQLIRTSTDQSGRYAVDGLPWDILTVLLSPPGQMPLATRVMLTSDLPVRQDFVLPTQGPPVTLASCVERESAAFAAATSSCALAGQNGHLPGCRSRGSLPAVRRPPPRVGHRRTAAMRKDSSGGPECSVPRGRSAVTPVRSKDQKLLSRTDRGDCAGYTENLGSWSAWSRYAVAVCMSSMVKVRSRRTSRVNANHQPSTAPTRLR